MPPVFRFAPSPNGYLHLGHALSALLNADLAHANSGRFLLRIEDIDTARCRPEYETAVYEDLAWLGLHWESPIRRQSENWDNYRGALAQLEATGLIYPSFESRAEIVNSVSYYRREIVRNLILDANNEKIIERLTITLNDNSIRISCNEPSDLTL